MTLSRTPTAPLAIPLLLAVAALAAAMHLGGWLARPEAAILDAWMGLRSSPPTDPRILLVEVDEGVGPLVGVPSPFWTARYAEAVQALLDAGAAAVGLDLILKAERSRLPNDSPIRSALEEGEAALGRQVLRGRVVLGEAWRPDSPEPLRSVETLHFAASGLGNTGMLNVATDPDGTVRRLPLFWTDSAPGRTRSFVGRLAELALAAELVKETDAVTLAGRPVATEDDGGSLRIHFPNAPVPFPVLRLSELLRNRRAPAEVRGRICLLGPGSEDPADLHRTPRDWRGGPKSLTPGLQIHAAALNTLLTGRYVRPAPAPVAVGLIVVASLAGFGLAFRSRPLWGLALAAAALGVLLAAGLLTLERTGLWIPAAAITVAGSASFLGGYIVRFLTVDRSRRQIRRLFGRYVSEPVMRELTRNPGSLALGGTRRRITVLFSDINDFTPMCERSTPEEVLEMLNRYFEEMVRIIFRHGGTVKQFVGDEIMVIYGAPEPSEDHAARAVATGLEMVERLQEMKRESGGRPGFYEVKIGIHTGDVVVGNVGAEARTEYAAVGDDVNLAARIESLAKTLGATMLVSAVTRAECSDAVPGLCWISRGEQTFKGRTARLEVFEVSQQEGSVES